MTAEGLPPNVEVRSRLAPDHGGYSIEDASVMRALALAEERHFWHRTRNQFIVDRLRGLGACPPAQVLELGCGGGSVAAHLSRAGYAVTGVDGHLPRILEAAARAPEAHFVVEDLSKPNVLADLGGADVVGLFDVIEHLDDPGQALARAVELCRPGGIVAGTVPALMALWSEADRSAGHRTRFELVGLERLVRAVPGATVLEVVPFNRLLVPLVWLDRRARADGGAGGRPEHYLRVPWAPVNRFLSALLRMEHGLGSVLPRSMPGASLWFALRRSS
jgi:SAM-dependent methyltransferase